MQNGTQVHLDDMLMIYSSLIKGQELNIVVLLERRY